MNLPEKYSWLKTIELPRTISRALEYYGIQEVVGKGSNATIIKWRDTLASFKINVDALSDDDIPWCGLFVAWICYLRMGRPEEVVQDPLWARNWAKYGNHTVNPGLGDILVFRRGKGGHVGFYICEDDECYHVLGGNQSNQVCITRIEKSRLLDSRRPPYNNVPPNAKPFYTNSQGKISSNEA